MDTEKIADYKMRCLEIAERIGPKNSEVVLGIAKKLYDFLEITFTNSAAK